VRSKLATVFFCLFLAATLWADESQLKTVERPPPARHGTTVEFVGTPIEAAKLAAKQKKLVLILHVSGHFEDPDFT
jgi:hypothetical protein